MTDSEGTMVGAEDAMATAARGLVSSTTRRVEKGSSGWRANLMGTSFGFS
ncbi:MAG: hypothetical protein NXI31_05135 [bacterium]|nr:hypothetical protein [bacterium]